MDRRAFLWTSAGLGALGAGRTAAAAEPSSAPSWRLSGGYEPRYLPALNRIGLYAAEHMRVHRLPGMTMALVGPGLDAQISLGFSDLERQAPVQPAQLFHIGSISKSFTAVMIHQLAAEGRLGIDDPLDRHLAGLPLPAGATITLAQLLAHTSGLPEDAPFFPRTPDGRLWVGFQPGSAWSYSNTGFDLLGRVVEVKDGRPLAASMQARIFGPLGMKDARGGLDPAEAARFAVGYGPRDPDADYAPDAPLVPAPFELFTGGAGCVGANAPDMAKWIRWLIGAGRGAGGPLMPHAQAKAFARPQAPAPGWAIKGSSYGSGLAHVPLEGRMVMQHTGGMLAFHSSIHVDPQGGVGAFASVNSGAGEYRPRDVTAFACALLRSTAEPQVGLDPQPAKVSWTRPPPARLDTAGAEPEHVALAGRFAAGGLAYGTMTLIAVKGGLALRDGTMFEKAPEGYWRAKATAENPGPIVERMWFANPVNGRPQNLIVSGAVLERI